MNQFRMFRTFFLFAIVIPCFCVAQNNKKESINIQKLIEALNLSLNNNYVFPEKAKSISIYLQAQLKRNVYDALQNNPDKLAEKINTDINSIHRDPHLHIQYDPGFVQQDERKPSEEEIKQNKKFWKENNYSFKKLEILPGNIGYFSLEGFMDDIESAKPTINSAMQFLSNTSALIIDLRENRGGSPEMVSQIESYFFKVKTHMNDIVSRMARDTTVFYADPAKADGLYLSMPVYILTSHNTFSAAEDFCYAMQMEKRATIVGEITGGGAHPQMPFSVGQGFVVDIPFARSLNPITKTNWEGTGIQPDIEIMADKGKETAHIYAIENIARQSQWGIIGNATPNNWDSDQPMIYNEASKTWKITLDLKAGEFKFRANSNWNINLGDTKSDGVLKLNGNNLKVDANGNYTVSLMLNIAGNYTYKLIKN
jgi:retinol-binding protein 3